VGKLLFTALASLPLSVRRRLGGWGGFLFSLIPTRDRAIAELQLRLFLPDRNTRTLVRQVYAEAGRTALTALDLSPLLQEIDSPDEDFIAELRQGSRPVLALTAHLGPWDLLGAYAVSKGLSVATIGRAARSPALHRLLTTLRSRYGITTFWRDDPQALRRIVGHLRNRGLIAALIDQDTRVEGTLSDFFGEPAFTPSTLIDISRRYDARIVTAFIVRLPSGRYEVNVKPIHDGAPLAEVLAIYHSRLEELIRRYPAQWVWFHKRWRTLPSGARLSSREYVSYLQGKISARGNGVKSQTPQGESREVS
jgi:KDO2-lipid IV(A) lauroyltransferase